MPTRTADAPLADGETTIGQYLIDRLAAIGVRSRLRHPGRLHPGAVPDARRASPIDAGRRHEARTPPGSRPMRTPGSTGSDASAVTYCVGGLSTVQQRGRGLCGEVARRDRSSGGSPGIERAGRGIPLLHHKVKGFETQFEVMEKLTVAATVLDDPMPARSPRSIGC